MIIIDTNLEELVVQNLEDWFSMLQNKEAENDNFFSPFDIKYMD